MPSEPNLEPIPQDKADSLVDWIAGGKTLREWCRIEGNPSKSTVYRWEKQDEQLAGRIARARDIGRDEIAEETLEIADEMPMMTVTGDSASGSWSKESVDPAGIQRNKVRIETRLKLLAKWDPRKWGDRIDLNHAGDVQISVADRLKEARAKRARD